MLHAIASETDRSATERDTINTAGMKTKAKEQGNNRRLAVFCGIGRIGHGNLLVVGSPKKREPDRQT
jgi:hypothetical protein